jgi:hypothetical protein
VAPTYTATHRNKTVNVDKIEHIFIVLVLPTTSVHNILSTYNSMGALCSLGPRETAQRAHVLRRHCIYCCVIIKKHALFCYYSIKRQISTKLIAENMFCMKAHQCSIVVPSKSRLVQLRIYTSYTKTCFFLGITCYFSRMTYFWSFVLFRCYDFIRSLYYF